MSKNVLVLAGIAVGALFFSSRPGQVSAEPQGIQRAIPRHHVKTLAKRPQPTRRFTNRNSHAGFAPLQL